MGHVEHQSIRLLDQSNGHNQYNAGLLHVPIEVRFYM